MRTILKNNIGYESYTLFYILPYKRNDMSDSDLLKNTELFLSNSNLYKINVKVDDEKIVLSATYEGYESYYDYELFFDLVNVKDNENNEDFLMLLGYISQDEHELFEEIIKEKILPKWVKELGLINYYSHYN
jgi:hypothetical protein